jgi:hypothetical protein
MSFRKSHLFWDPVIKSLTTLSKSRRITLRIICTQLNHLSALRDENRNFESDPWKFSPQTVASVSRFLGLCSRFCFVISCWAEVLIAGLQVERLWKKLLSELRSKIQISFHKLFLQTMRKALCDCCHACHSAWILENLRVFCNNAPEITLLCLGLNKTHSL